jgi:mannosyltransferase
MSCCAIATALAVHRLGTMPLWIDEVASVSAASRSMKDLFHMLRHLDTQNGLYDVLLHFWLRFGTGEAWDRGLSVIFGVAAVGAAGWSSGRWRGPTAAVSASFLLATNTFWLYYTQEARAYSLPLFLSFVSTAMLATALSRTDRLGLIYYGVVTTLLLYANLFAVLFVVSQGLAVIGRPGWRRLLGAWVGIALCSAPLALYMLAFENTAISWISPPTVYALVRTIGLYTVHRTGFIAYAALGTVAVLYRSRERTDLTVPAVAGAVLPFVMLWLLSFAHPVFADRYCIASLSAIVMVGAGGIAALTDRGHGVVALVVTVALGALGLSHEMALYRLEFKIQDARSAARYIATHMEEGDAIVYSHDGDRLSVDFYWPRQGERGRPADIGLVTGQDVVAAGRIFPEEVPISVMYDRLARVTRVWLLYHPDDTQLASYLDLLPRLRDRFRPGHAEDFGQINVVLWSPP